MDNDPRGDPVRLCPRDSARVLRLERTSVIAALEVPHFPRAGSSFPIRTATGHEMPRESDRSYKPDFFGSALDGADIVHPVQLFFPPN